MTKKEEINIRKLVNLFAKNTRKFLQVSKKNSNVRVLKILCLRKIEILQLYFLKRDFSEEKTSRSIEFQRENQIGRHIEPFIFEGYFHKKLQKLFFADFFLNQQYDLII
jgi:hypothetical protein